MIFNYNLLLIDFTKWNGLYNKLVKMNESKKPASKPIYPIKFNKMMDSATPNRPWSIETIVVGLLNFKADKKTTDTLSKIIKTVKIK